MESATGSFGRKRQAIRSPAGNDKVEKLECGPAALADFDLRLLHVEHQDSDHRPTM